MTNQNSQTKLAIAILASILIVSTLTIEQALATNSGLKVVVTVENVPRSAVGETAGVTVTSASDQSIFRAVIVPDAESFFTTLQFAPGEVSVGETVAACVHIDNTGLEGCGKTVNSEASQPENIFIRLDNRNTNDNIDSGSGSGSASASSSDSTSDSSSSSSSSATVVNNFSIFGAGDSNN